jgi:hypothetical protein
VEPRRSWGCAAERLRASGMAATATRKADVEPSPELGRELWLGGGVPPLGYVALEAMC